MSATRLERLVKLGIATHQEAIRQKRASHSMIEAIAAMIDFATAKPAARPKVPRDAGTIAKLPFGPGDVFKRLEETCADIIQLRPYEAQSFGRLGRALCGVQGLETDDLERVASWIQSGGLATWPNKVVWNHVCRHFPTWIAYARSWEANGGSANPAALGSEAWR
jgi:hypothetical protein